MAVQGVDLKFAANTNKIVEDLLDSGRGLQGGLNGTLAGAVVKDLNVCPHFEEEEELQPRDSCPVGRGPPDDPIEQHTRLRRYQNHDPSINAKKEKLQPEEYHHQRRQRKTPMPPNKSHNK